MKRSTCKRTMQEEIQAHLASLNRLEDSATVSIDTDRLRAMAIANNRQWFKDQHIGIYQDERTHEWRLGHAAKEQEPSSKEQASEA